MRCCLEKQQKHPYCCFQFTVLNQHMSDNLTMCRTFIRCCWNGIPLSKICGANQSKAHLSNWHQRYSSSVSDGFHSFHSFHFLKGAHSIWIYCKSEVLYILHVHAYWTLLKLQSRAVDRKFHHSLWSDWGPWSSPGPGGGPSLRKGTCPASLSLGEMKMSFLKLDGKRLSQNKAQRGFLGSSN